MTPESIYMTEVDYLRIKKLIDGLDEDYSELENELERAQVLKKEEVPADIVTMNSRLEILNLTDNKTMTLQLVYPGETKSQDHKISILAPLGTALIGLRIGDEIDWRFPDQKTRRLKVMAIIYQPEANSHWHL